MDSDSNDSLPKLSRMSGEAGVYLPGCEAALGGLLSPVTLQTQRHLLSSTLQEGLPRNLKGTVSRKSWRDECMGH
jgi:hypothetical protein